MPVVSERYVPVQRRSRGRATHLVVGVVSALCLTACADPLKVSDPNAIDESHLGTERIAVGFWRTALDKLDFGSDAARETGMLTDEFFWNPSGQDLAGVYPSPSFIADKRDENRYLSLMIQQRGYPVYSGWQSLRLAATIAIRKLQPFATKPEHAVQIAESYALRALAALRLAQNVCPGFALNTVDSLYGPVFGPPLTTNQVLEHALADFDSAASYAADSARILNFARIGRAAALLELGRYAEASQATAGVPDSYTYTGRIADPLGKWGSNQRSVSNSEGGNGLNFVTANDPRAETILLGPANDPTVMRYDVAKYVTGDGGNGATPLVLLSGIEARLIEAEAALHEHGDDGAWLTMLNNLRATAITPAMDTLVDPGTTAGRVDLLYRERAFWLFATDHRLADLRRLMRLYGRAAESLFPTGRYQTGEQYGTMTSIPFPGALETTTNPAVTGCTEQ